MKQKTLVIPIPADQHKALKVRAAQTGTSVANLVRSSLAASFAFQTPDGAESRQKLRRAV